MTTTVSTETATQFRQYLPDLSIPRFTTAKQQDARTYAAAFQESHVPPWLYNLTQAWTELLQEPYKGVTSDGNVRPGLFEQEDHGIDTAAIISAVDEVLSQLTPDQQSKVRHPINSGNWRAWSNPEFLLRDLGLRLEDLSEETAQAILAVVEASFSPRGYEKAIAAMRINHFLGEVCQVEKIMNQYSYNFLLFGEPDAEKAWGWSLYGHHLCLNVFIKGTHMVISPTFTGAEPNVIDQGPHAGTAILATEGELGLALMQSLPVESQRKAQLYTALRDPGMRQTGDLKVDEWNKDDQRHLCGAFRDNRVVPLQGVAVGSFTSAQKQQLLDIVDQFALYLPQGARAHRLRQVARHFDDTWFSWIGGHGDDDAYYFRIQSPVIICEFDHHSGVFLTNTEPAKFHTHTILRTPNAGDYGNALRQEPERLP